MVLMICSGFARQNRFSANLVRFLKIAERRAENSNMTIGGNIPSATVASTSPSSDVQRKMSIELLKRTLDDQKDASAQLLSSLEPKGRVIDIRA